MIAKVLAIRLSRVLDSVIGVYQGAFIQGRHIYDNLIVAHEILDTLKRKRVGKYGSMILKLDMSKAFNRVEWGFLCSLMQHMEFLMEFINLILIVCILSPIRSRLMVFNMDLSNRNVG